MGWWCWLRVDCRGDAYPSAKQLVIDTGTRKERVPWLIYNTFYTDRNLEWHDSGCSTKLCDIADIRRFFTQQLRHFHFLVRPRRTTTQRRSINLRFSKELFSLSPPCVVPSTSSPSYSILGYTAVHIETQQKTREYRPSWWKTALWAF